MEYRRKDLENEESNKNPPQIQPETTFSKPLLPSSSSLLPPKPPSPHNGFRSSAPCSRPPPTSSSSTPSTSPSTTSTINYRECLKNHAATIGGHVIDGCCEFMPACDSDPMKCAACGCHRNFHRRESSISNVPNSFIAFVGGSNVAGTTTESSSEERNVGVLVKNNKKRFRTKFTRDQKERMIGFAERIGWRIQRQDEGDLVRFCGDIGVSRQVFKVWMHNNKQHYSIKKQHRGGGGGSAEEESGWRELREGYGELELS